MIRPFFSHRPSTTNSRHSRSYGPRIGVKPFGTSCQFDRISAPMFPLSPQAMSATVAYGNRGSPSPCTCFATSHSTPRVSEWESPRTTRNPPRPAIQFLGDWVDITTQGTTMEGGTYIILTVLSLQLPSRYDTAKHFFFFFSSFFYHRCILIQGDPSRHLRFIVRLFFFLSMIPDPNCEALCQVPTR